MDKSDSLFIDFRVPHNVEELIKYIPIDLELFEKARVQFPDQVSPKRTTTICGIEAQVLEIPVYFRHEIPKRRRHRLGIRLVWEAATNQLSDSYKAFNYRFDLFLKNTLEGYPRSNVYGYVKDRSTIDNATPHCGANLVLRADIKNFFQSISLEKLRRHFEAIGISPNVTRPLAEFLCIENSLPLGLSPSPMLANFIFHRLDEQLERLANRHKCKYTRYADDMTFSGANTVPNKSEISAILNEEGFILSDSKFRLSKLGQCHYVTGLSVSDPVAPRAPRSMKARLRQELYFCRKFGIRDHIALLTEGDDYRFQPELNRLDGTVKYVAHIERERWPLLREEWRRMLQKERLKPSFRNLQERFHEIFYIYADESEIDLGDSKLLALCCSIVQHPDLLQNVTTATLRKHIANPFSDGDTEALQKRGLHYVDATQDLRKAYLDQLHLLASRSYVAFSKLTDTNDFEELYHRLFSYLIPNRLKAAEGATVRIFIEENSKINRKKITELINSILEKLVENNDRHPATVSVIVGSKKEVPNFSLPDFMLGVLGSAMKLKKSDPTATTRREILFFETMRDKYRIIADLDNKKLYSRKRPIDLAYYQR